MSNVFQKDSPFGQKSKVTKNWFKANLCSYRPASSWTPSSPDLNPLDYGVWGEIETKACASPHPNVQSLKAAVEREWDNMSIHFVKKTCVAFRPRIEAMLEAEGGHFEK